MNGQMDRALFTMNYRVPREQNYFRAVLLGMLSSPFSIQLDRRRHVSWVMSLSTALYTTDQYDFGHTSGASACHIRKCLEQDILTLHPARFESGSANLQCYARQPFRIKRRLLRN